MKLIRYKYKQSIVKNVGKIAAQTATWYLGCLIVLFFIIYNFCIKCWPSSRRHRADLLLLLFIRWAYKTMCPL